MERIKQTALRSIPAVLFLMLVCLGFLGFLALPAVAKLLGPWVCDAGSTMVDVQTPYSRPGESGVAVEYFCEDENGARVPASEWNLAKAGLTFYVAIFILVVWPLVTWLRVRSASRTEHFLSNGIPAKARVVSVSQTNMRINEKPVIKYEFEIEQEGRPSFIKKVRKATPQVLIPQLQPGKTIPALIDPLAPTKVMLQFDQIAPDEPDSEFGESEDELDALRALKQMYDEGLIDFAEYDAKKAEIMDRM